MSLKQKLTLSTILMILGIFFVLLGYIALPFAMIGAAAAVAGIVLTFRWHRCPDCGNWLGRDGIPNFCPTCGKKIDPDEKAR